MDSIICIVLGMLFANGVPHFVKGITAAKMGCSMAKSLLPLLQMYCWGIANWLVVVILYALFKPDVNSFDAACVFNWDGDYRLLLGFTLVRENNQK